MYIQSSKKLQSVVSQVFSGTKLDITETLEKKGSLSFKDLCSNIMTVDGASHNYANISKYTTELFRNDIISFDENEMLYSKNKLSSQIVKHLIPHRKYVEDLFRCKERVPIYLNILMGNMEDLDGNFNRVDVWRAKRNMDKKGLIYEYKNKNSVNPRYKHYKMTNTGNKISKSLIRFQKFLENYDMKGFRKTIKSESKRSENSGLPKEIILEFEKEIEMLNKGYTKLTKKYDVLLKRDSELVSANKKYRREIKDLKKKISDLKKTQIDKLRGTKFS